ncbi:MAG: PAS domain S-box protein, partial [Desulfobacteraceae bacterium]
MHPFRFFRDMRIKYKLIFAFLLALAPIFTAGTIVSFWVMKSELESNMESELHQITETLANSVESSARVAIQNYLRAVAEQNISIMEILYGRFETENFSWNELMTAVEDMLGSQAIGESGYLFCIDSNGEITYHPSSELVGNSYSSFSFTQEILTRGGGYIEYDWKNPGEASERPKALYAAYFEPMDWYIAVSTYREEFKSLVRIEDIDNLVHTLNIGTYGFSFVTDETGKHYHSSISGEEESPTHFFPATQVSEMISRKTGILEYTWEAPGVSVPQSMKAFYSYLPAYGWIVGAAYSENELRPPLERLGAVVLLTALLTILAAFLVSFRFGALANRTFSGLMDRFGKGATGDFTARLEIVSKDELGILAGHFNTFMEKLDIYNQGMRREIEKRQRSENKYRLLYESCFDGFVITNRDGILTECNSTFESMLGYTRDELIGLSPDHITPSAWSEVLNTQLEKHVHARGYSDIFEKEYIRKDGSLVPVELRIHAITDEQGELTGYWAFVRDISNRKASEKELRKLAMALEQAHEMVVITDTDGVIEYVNPSFEKVSGYTRSEVTGRKPSLLKSGLHDQAFYAQMWRTITAGKTWAGRLINKKKDGALFHEDAIITPMRQKDGNISHYVAAKRDVTAHVQLENQLRQSQRIEAIGSLAGGIAHDFNNILSGIMGYTEMCLYEAADDSPLRGRLDKVLQASHRAKDLIRHIQTFSRQTKFERKPFLLHSVVKEASKLLRASIPSSIEFKTRVDKVGVVLGDPTQIHQVIMNLCTNAYHAMKETDGVLSVTLDKESVSADSALCRLGLAPGPCARLVVGDTGCGIPEEVKEKIFDPYFTTKPEGEGSGLGLAVVHGIVNGLGGHIDVSSEVGKGTTFTIHLPLTESKADTGRARKAPITKGNQETVLVVDDDTTVLEITSE